MFGPQTTADDFITIPMIGLEIDIVDLLLTSEAQIHLPRPLTGLENRKIA